MISGTEILTAAQMRAMESAAMASGAVTGLELMERAGAGVSCREPALGGELDGLALLFQNPGRFPSGPCAPK